MVFKSINSLNLFSKTSLLGRYYDISEEFQSIMSYKLNPLPIMKNFPKWFCG